MVGAIRDKYRASWLGQPSEVTRGRLLFVSVALGFLFIGVSYLYLDAARRERAEADARLAVVEFQREVDEYDTCVQRAESREEIRGMFLTTFDVIEETTDSPNAFDPVRNRLDDRYPTLLVDDCEPPD